MPTITYCNKVILTFLLSIATLFPALCIAETNEATLSSPLQSASRYIRRFNPTLTDLEAQTFASYVLDYAQEFKLDPRLLLAIAKVESKFNPDAVGAGGRGLMQVVPRWHADKIATARKRLNVYSIYEPKLNLFVGAWVFRESLDVSDSVREALLVYNGSASDKKATYAKLVLNELKTIKL